MQLCHWYHECVQFVSAAWMFRDQPGGHPSQGSNNLFTIPHVAAIIINLTKSHLSGQPQVPSLRFASAASLACQLSGWNSLEFAPRYPTCASKDGTFRSVSVRLILVAPRAFLAAQHPACLPSLQVLELQFMAVDGKVTHAGTARHKSHSKATTHEVRSSPASRGRPAAGGSQR